MIEVRGDGMHLTWVQGSQVVPERRNLHIILKDVTSPDRLSDDSLLKVRAFIIASLEEAEPRRTYERWRRLLANGSTYHHNLSDGVGDVQGAIRKTFEESDAKQKSWARDELKRSVFKAHELLPHDEVETIVREALVEYVLKQ